MYLVTMGRFGEALVSVDKALEIEPDSSNGMGLRAIILYELGRREESVAVFERL